jgi:integrase
VTHLRKMMLEELQRRNYSAITTRNYLQVVSDFAKHFGKSPDKQGPNELRTYQAYLLKERKLTPGTVANWVSALRFFFVKTLKRHQFRDFLPYPHDRRRLPTVLSREEISRLINAAGTLFRRTLLMTLSGIQIPWLTASAANASGFLLVSLSKTPRIEIPAPPQKPTLRRFRSRLATIRELSHGGSNRNAVGPTRGFVR